jgi:hypothetical protein
MHSMSSDEANRRGSSSAVLVRFAADMTCGTRDHIAPPNTARRDALARDGIAMLTNV